MKRITVYKPSELKRIFPDAFERAWHDWAEDIDEIPWMDETIDSLKAIFKACRIQLLDWALGPYDYRNHVRFNMGDAAELSGQRAVAWLENNLYGPMRIPWTGARRWKVLKYGEHAGELPPCPLTGYCADDDFIDCLNRNVADGMTLQDSFSDLARECGRLLAAEAEDAVSEESFLECGMEFTREGRPV